LFYLLNVLIHGVFLVLIFQTGCTSTQKYMFSCVIFFDLVFIVSRTIFLAFCQVFIKRTWYGMVYSQTCQAWDSCIWDLWHAL